MKTLYVDGDMVAYRAACSNEVEIQWDDDIWTLQTNFNAAVAYVDDFVASMCNRFDTEKYVLVFSPKTNFRHDLFPEYKANRKNKRKPLALKEIIETLFLRHPSARPHNMEADDWIGVKCTADPDKTIALSGDKDFATLPITWYNFLQDTLHTLTPEEAAKNHLRQTLTGDATDGYSGLKGVGPKTADKLLDKHGWNWESVVEIYEKKGQTEEEALLTARLAYILQHQNFDKGTIKLWTPTI